jgi:cation:H+ antiporter
VAALLPLPALILRAGLVPLPPLAATAAYGIAVLGAAFLLTWAAEAAERELSGPIAFALLALVALLPEYAVDTYFAWTAGHQPAYAAYAAANMTGANRLLIGLGWTLVVAVFWLKTRSSLVVLAQQHALELGVLTAATLYAFSIPLKRSLSPFDALVLFALFLVYLWLLARSPGEEVELLGPAARIGALPRRARRALLAILFVYAAGLILRAAEPFANGLVETGASFGIDRFLLVQWLAPLASEAPELIAVVLLCLRARAAGAMTVLLSSVVNQWTLLVGGLPLAYSVGHGGLASLPLDGRQTEEFLLTAAQSLFAVAILLNLSLSLREALLLFALFVAAIVLQSPAARYTLVAIDLILALAAVWLQRRQAHTALHWWDAGRNVGTRLRRRRPKAVVKAKD